MAYTSINKPSDYFNVVTWTGTSDSTTAVTGVGHQPDFIWIKNRGVADDHMVYDAIRGGTKRIFTNSTGAEGTESQGIQSFDSDGFTTGTHRATGGDSGNTMVSWNWKGANGTASNTDGSITSSVSANTTAGFSIVSYTGTGANATVGHGLGVAPKMIIVKNRSTAGNWPVFHQTQGGTKIQWLNLTNTTATESGWWNNTDPTSSVFSIGTQNDLNKSSDNIIAYCFAEKKGYSKFGQYEGNANADGTFVYTGFLPAWVMVKNIDAAENWIIFDNKRPGYNLTDALLKPNLSNTESTSGVKFDLLSNGFKARVSDAEGNSSSTFIYMAFAEHPFVSSTGTPVTAR